jgi:hypothetical protein
VERGLPNYVGHVTHVLYVWLSKGTKAPEGKPSLYLKSTHWTAKTPH